MAALAPASLIISLVRQLLSVAVSLTQRISLAVSFSGATSPEALAAAAARVPVHDGKSILVLFHCLSFPLLFAVDEAIISKFLAGVHSIA